MAMKISIILVFCCVVQLVSAQLQAGFYSTACPQAETIVSQVVATHFGETPNVTAALLRMHFHDCFVKGCDASILLDSTPGRPSEKEAGPNLSVRGFDLIDEAKNKLEEVCPLTVSCADIITLATRDSVALAGGLTYIVRTGRRDGSDSDASAVNLPSSDLSVTDALGFFTAKNLNLEEMVTLLGAHTVGVTHCSFITTRLSNDPSMDPALKASLSKTCEASGIADPEIFLDQSTPFFVDNQFYSQVMKRRGVLQIDQNLGLDKSSAPTVAKFSYNNNLFQQKFIDAMIKMGEIEVLVGIDGQIRKDCRVVG